MRPCHLVYSRSVLAPIFYRLYRLITHLTFCAAIPLTIWGILLSLGGRVYLYWHVVKWVNKSLESLLGRRLEVFRGLTFFARLWVLSSAVPATLYVLALNRLHTILICICLRLMGFIWVGERIRRVWTGLRLYQLRNCDRLSLFLPLNQIWIVVTRLVWGVVLSCLNLLAGRTTCLKPTTTFFVKMQFGRLLEGVFVLDFDFVAADTVVIFILVEVLINVGRKNVYWVILVDFDLLSWQWVTTWVVESV